MILKEKAGGGGGLVYLGCVWLLWVIKTLMKARRKTEGGKDVD